MRLQSFSVLAECVSTLTLLTRGVQTPHAMCRKLYKRSSHSLEVECNDILLYRLCFNGTSISHKWCKLCLMIAGCSLDTSGLITRTRDPATDSIYLLAVATAVVLRSETSLCSYFHCAVHNSVWGTNPQMDFPFFFTTIQCKINETIFHLCYLLNSRQNHICEKPL